MMSIGDMLEQVATHYGEKAQQKQTIEECAELTQAICKLDRGGTREQYIEELADVHIMTSQLAGLLTAKEYDHYVKMIRIKLERQLERIKNNE